MLSVIPNPDITAADMKLLRSLSPMSLADIRRCSAEQTSVRDIEIFGPRWQDERDVIAYLSNLMATNDRVPFSVRIHDEFGNDDRLSGTALDDRIVDWCDLEQETQRHSELELGTLLSPDNYQPSDTEWATESQRRISARNLNTPR